MNPPLLSKSTTETREAVKVPAHVLRELSSPDIAELVKLWNSGEPGDSAKALAWAGEVGKRFDQEHAPPVRCPVCQRFSPCPVHPEHTP